MIDVNNTTKWLYMTRADTAEFTFSAKDKEGNSFHPTAKDKLIFKLSKKRGEVPLLIIENEMILSESDFWTIHIDPEDTEDCKSGKYAYDVEIEQYDSSTGAFISRSTIIGETEELSPTLVLWGEV